MPETLARRQPLMWQRANTISVLRRVVNSVLMLTLLVMFALSVGVALGTGTSMQLFLTGFMDVSIGTATSNMLWCRRFA